MKILFEKNSRVLDKGLNVVEKTPTHQFEGNALTVRMKDVKSEMPTFSMYFNPYNKCGKGSLIHLYPKITWDHRNGSYTKIIHHNEPYRVENGVRGEVEIQDYFTFLKMIPDVWKLIEGKILNDGTAS